MIFSLFGDTFENRDETWELMAYFLPFYEERIQEEHSYEYGLIEQLTKCRIVGTDKDSLVILRNQGRIFGQSQIKLPFKPETLDELITQIGVNFRTNQRKPKFIQFSYDSDFSRPYLDLDFITMGEILKQIDLEDVRYKPVGVHYGLNSQGNIERGLLEIGYKL